MTGWVRRALPHSLWRLSKARHRRRDFCAWRVPGAAAADRNGRRAALRCRPVAAARRVSMLRVAFVGALAAGFAESVRANLAVPCEIVVADESEVISLLAEVDVLVTLVFTPAMGA